MQKYMIVKNFKPWFFIVAFVLLAGGMHRFLNQSGPDIQIVKPSSIERKSRKISQMVKIKGGVLVGKDNFNSFQHFVDNFWLDKTEVTVAQYSACVMENKCPVPKMDNQFSNWRKSNREDHPMTSVTWEEADNYCKAISKRLPTEHEWEWAARGEDLRLYPWGNDEIPIDHICWRFDQTEQTTCEVGSHVMDSTPDGVMDMAGNASEWTATLWCGNYTRFCKKADFDDLGTLGNHIFHVVRGGCWLSTLPALETTFRNIQVLPLVGFRCAQSE